jgi:trans-aconitate methyltransferase
MQPFPEELQTTLLAYTDGLYSVPEVYRPSYDEFRDMFSRGQIGSKKWLIESLTKNKIILPEQEIIIVGSWFGTLGALLGERLPNNNIKLLDLRRDCYEFAKVALWRNKRITPIMGDMYDYKYTEDIVINTSCEHIRSLRDWLDTIKPGTFVVLQSNNNADIDDHISTVSTIEEFIEQARLREVTFGGWLPFQMYTRFMIMGYV